MKNRLFAAIAPKLFRSTVITALTIAAGFAAVSEAADSIPIKYKLDKDGRVSLAVYDQQGVMMRTLSSGEPQKAGEHTVLWDGMDTHGKPVEAETYNWKLLLGRGLKSKYLLSLGTSFGAQHWPAQHDGPNALAVAGDDFYVGSGSEGSPGLVKATLDGKVLWMRGSHETLQTGSIDMAVADGNVAVLYSSAKLYIMDAEAQKNITAFSTALPLKKINVKEQSARASEKPGTLSVDVPSGKYQVSIQLEANEMKWLAYTVGSEKGGFEPKGAAKSWMIPSAYNIPYPAEAKDGKLVMTFEDAVERNKRKPTDPPLPIPSILKELEIFAVPSHFDMRDGQLVLLYQSGGGIVAWADMKSGKILDKVTLPGARDVAIVSQDSVLVAAGDTVKLVKKSGTSETVISGLTDAELLAYDVVSGELFVYQGGKSQQIKKFDRKYKLLATFGSQGGRKYGCYEPLDFLSVANMAVDGKGGFMITEAQSAPRRTAHFDKNGKLLNEWYGGQQFYTYAAPDPKDPTLVWMDSQWGSVMQVKADYDKGTWKPLATYRLFSEVDGKLVSLYKMAMRHHVLRRDCDGDGTDETYIWFESAPGLILKVDEKAGLLRPFAIASRVNLGPYGNWFPVDTLPKAWLEAIKLLGKDPNSEAVRRSHTGFTWADANGDGIVQAEEMRLIEVGGHGFAGTSTNAVWIDSKMNIWFGAGYHGVNKAGWSIMPAESYTKVGAPVWDWKTWKENLEKAPKSPFFTTADVLPGDNDSIYQLGRGGGDDYKADSGIYAMGHGWTWPSNLSDATGLAKWSADGRMLWRVGSLATKRDNMPGQQHHPMMILGRFNGFIAVSDKIVLPMSAWTDDGLYVGGMFDRRADDGLSDTAYTWWRGKRDGGDGLENRSLIQYDMILGANIAPLPDGDLLVYTCGWNNVPVYRVSGWKDLSRQEGTVKLSAPLQGAAAQGKGLTGEYFAAPDFSGNPVLRQIDARIWFEPGRKGFPWPKPESGAAAVAARWTGSLEPLFSEDYTFSIYAKGAVRLWLAGKLLIDKKDSGKLTKYFALPVKLSAGDRYPVKLEWSGAAEGELHLNWQSMSQQIEHVPVTALYPEQPVPELPEVSVKPSAYKFALPVPGAAAQPFNWTVSRKGVLDKPLNLGLKWDGTALTGIQMEPLPAAVTIPKGKSEVTVPLHLNMAKDLLPTQRLSLEPAISAQYLQDGKLTPPAVELYDPRLVTLKVADVQAKAEKDFNISYPVNLQTQLLAKLIDGSGLDRTKDPALHDTDIKNAWYAQFTDPDKTFLTFDLGALVNVVQIRVWNLNTRSSHGKGWGMGPTVRDAAKKICIKVSGSAEGPWVDLGFFELHRPDGDKGDPGDLLPVSKKCRFVQICFSRPYDANNIGLAEVEFYGVAEVRK